VKKRQENITYETYKVTKGVFYNQASGMLCYTDWKRIWSYSNRWECILHRLFCRL